MEGSMEGSMEGLTGGSMERSMECSREGSAEGSVASSMEGSMEDSMAHVQRVLGRPFLQAHPTFSLVAVPASVPKDRQDSSVRGKA